jgi:DNA-binding winged helix-turn-helix (wHTH) protein
MNTHSKLIYEFKPYRLDPGEGKLFRSGNLIKLGPIPFRLLTYFVQHPRQVLERDVLLNEIWPGKGKDETLLAVTIAGLRKKLGAGRYIEAVAGRGYIFTAEVKVTDCEPSAQSQPPPPGGAVPLDSPFYIARKTDEEFYQAISRRDSIVLVKGARQVGKTSLLARGLQKARESGAVVVLTDLQHPSREAFVNLETLLLALGERIADQLDLKTKPHDTWSSLLGASTNFQTYLRREILGRISAPLVWGLDEIDRLFGFDYAGELFGLFRSWHNLRALEPAGPWRRMTLAMAYATEAHLFITDLNQSPFNVGTKLALEDFTLDQIVELNRRYDSPLKDETEIARYFSLIGGHPYLAQRGFYEITQHGLDLAAIEANADHDEGIFGEHLRRMWISLSRDATLCGAMRDVLQGKPGLVITDFYRLRSAGVLIGNSAQEAQLRCQLYARFLKKHLL